MLPALPPMNYDNLNWKNWWVRWLSFGDTSSNNSNCFGSLNNISSGYLNDLCYIIFRLRKNIKILFPMAKLLTGQATGSEAQEIKRVLLTLLEILAGQECPPPLPLRTARLAITPAQFTSARHHFNWSYSGNEGQDRDVNTPKTNQKVWKIPGQTKGKVAERH